jgi:hypothetical protein
MLCPGQVYHTSITVHGIQVAPSSAVLTITQPDGTMVQPAVGSGWSQSGTDWTLGYDYTLPTPGLFQFAWTTMGPGTAPYPDFVNVRRAASILGMAEAMQHLNETSLTDDGMSELANFLQVSTEMIEVKVGTLVPRQFTYRAEDGRYRILVPFRNILTVQSVTSVWPGGPAWTTPQLRWDSDAGIIDQIQPFPFWWAPWDIVLSCGKAEIPERFIHAAKEQLRHLWETQRGSQAPAVLQGEEVYTATTGFTFSVPRRVLELLEQDMVPSS